MKRIALSILLVLGLGQPAYGEESIKILIQSQPSGALVKRNNEELGVTGVEFSLAKDKLPSQGGLHLQLLRTNYKPYHLVIPPGELSLGDGKFPDSPVTLEPLHPWVPLQENPGPLGFGLLTLAAVIWGFRRNRQLKSAAHWRESRVARLKESIGVQHDFALHTIGRYRILNLLGAGGIAKVYRAVPDSTLDESQAVAVKILHPHLCKEGDHNERFVREGTVSKDLVHPNIVRLFEIDSDGDVVYLVLELLGGQTLKDKLQGRPFSPDQAKLILRQMFAGLVYAHDQGVVHRDLTPSNVMVGQSDHIKLMDFGLARRREVGHTITVTGVIQGTPGYMAPEQLTETLDARSDQYSLGVIMFEMLTGRRPIDRGDAMQLIMATYTEDVPDPREFNAEIPAPIAELILKMLRRDPGQRFDTMQDAADAFESAFRT